MPNKQAADIVVNAEIFRENRKLNRRLKRLQQCQETLSTLVYWHDKGNGTIDESWWTAARKLCPPNAELRRGGPPPLPPASGSPLRPPENPMKSGLP